mgnify:FL=1
MKTALLARDGDHIILISVVHEDSVVAGGMMFPPTIIPTDPEEIIAAKNHLIRMSRAIEACNSTLEVDWKVYKGEARDVLQTVAEKEGANALVVGTRGRGKVKRMFLGSTADFLIHHAHCTVVVVRPDEVDEEDLLDFLGGDAEPVEEPSSSSS